MLVGEVTVGSDECSVREEFRNEAEKTLNKLLERVFFTSFADSQVETSHNSTLLTYRFLYEFLKICSYRPIISLAVTKRVHCIGPFFLNKHEEMLWSFERQRWHYVDLFWVDDFSIFIEVLKIPSTIIVIPVKSALLAFAIRLRACVIVAWGWFNMNQGTVSVSNFRWLVTNVPFHNRCG